MTFETTAAAQAAKMMTAACAALCLAGAAAAADRPTQKAGLWEINSKNTVDGKPIGMMPDLDKMPPQARAQMEKMMAERGMSMPGAGPGGGTLTKLCIAKDHLAGPQMPQQQGDAKCEQKVTKQTATAMAWTYRCTGAHPSQGEGEARFDSPEKYSGWFTATSQHQGRTQSMRMDYSARWLGKDCGTIKPLEIPKG
jgi:hypothetical protein